MRTRREGPQQRALVAREADRGDLVRRPVHTRIRHRVEPPQALRVQVAVAEKLAPVEEVRADVADRPLHFAFGLRAIRPARANPKAPVRREAEKLRILHDAPAARSLILDDDGFELIEQQLVRHAPEREERLLEPAHQREHRLLRIEAQPQESRVPEHHHQRPALPPRELTLGEIHLRLVSGRGLEADDGLRLGPGAHDANKLFELPGNPAARHSSKSRTADSSGYVVRRS